jgi:hypothetical protein
MTVRTVINTHELFLCPWRETFGQVCASALLTALPAAAAVGTDGGWTGVQGTQQIAAPASGGWSGVDCADCAWGY